MCGLNGGDRHHTVDAGILYRSDQIGQLTLNFFVNTADTIT
jgi:hypothetical protein